MFYFQIHEPTVPADLLHARTVSELQTNELSLFGTVLKFVLLKIVLKRNWPVYATALSQPSLLEQTQVGGCLSQAFLHNWLYFFWWTGLISLWDTRENRCVMYWKAEPREIS